jgi:putative alpha-1,2-mannosidase
VAVDGEHGTDGTEDDEDDEIDLAWRALRKDAFNVSSGGRKGNSYYQDLGYLPYGQGIGDEVSTTLNYALADYSMAQAALTVRARLVLRIEALQTRQVYRDHLSTSAWARLLCRIELLQVLRVCHLMQ